MSKINIIKSILFNLHFYIFTSILVIVCIPLLFLPGDMMRTVSKFWAFILTTGMKTWLGVDYKVIGKIPQKNDVIYAIKHQSAWETVICTYLFKMPSIVLKKELIFLPFIGLYFLRGGGIAITRSNTLQSLKKMSLMAKGALKKGKSIMIFPQGTRVPINTKKEYPYLPGVYFIYSQCKVPVIPVAHNAGLLWPKNSFFKYPNKLKSKSISLEILDAIPPGLNKKNFMELLENKIESSTNKLIKKET